MPTSISSSSSGASQPKTQTHFIPMESPQVTLQWQSVTLDVKMKNPLTKQWEDKRILDNVHGIARPGELLALMGPSGAGKSSLLDCISGRNTAVAAESSVTLNGQPWTKRMKRFSSYIMQDDLFYQTITVREHLLFQARLRLGNKYSESECEARVKTVIEELGLTKCRDSLIGGPSVRGISGGERKRLSLATEMLTNPSILFVDEPTSGLDSFTAEAIVLQLQQLAHEGRTVIATIHQPSPEIFALFDKLYLLSDGAPVFHGNAQDVVPYFDSLGYQCPSFMNPSDYFMRQLVVMDKSSDPEGVKRLQFLKDAWTERRYREQPPDEAAFASSSASIAAQEFQDTRLGAARQVLVLAKRNIMRLVRDRIAFKAALFQTIFISLLVGLIYLQLDLTQKGIQNFAGVFFFISMNQTLITAKPLFVAVPIELPMIIREYKAGLFNLLSWYLSKNISEVVFQVFLPIVYFIPLYFLVGIGHGFQVYISMQVIIILINSAAAGFGYMVTSFCRRVDIAPIVGVALILPFLLFGGLFLNSADAPDYLVWIQYISPVKYGFEALMKIYWGQVSSIPCNGPIENCIAASGGDVLKLYSMKSRTAFVDAVIMIVLNIAFRTIGFLALWLNLRSAN